MSDIGNHLQPDAVYNCEQIGTSTAAPAAFLLQHLPPRASAPPFSPSPAGICPKLPPGSASILSANVTETISGLVKVKAMINVSKVGGPLRHLRKQNAPSLLTPLPPCTSPLLPALSSSVSCARPWLAPAWT
jgi:hypothetical protein